jgi:hypothetical protein
MGGKWRGAATTWRHCGADPLSRPTSSATLPGPVPRDDPRNKLTSNVLHQGSEGDCRIWQARHNWQSGDHAERQAVRIAALAGLLVLLLGATVAQNRAERARVAVKLAPNVVLRVDTSRPGNEFALGAVGLSI